MFSVFPRQLSKQPDTKSVNIITNTALGTHRLLQIKLFGKNGGVCGGGVQLDDSSLGFSMVYWLASRLLNSRVPGSIPCGISGLLDHISLIKAFV